MRIVLISRSLPFHRLGGMEVVAWDLARAFVKKGAEVTVLTTACRALAEDSCIEGVRIRCVPAPSGRYSLAFWLRSREVYRTELEAHTDVLMGVGGGARLIGLLRDKRGPLVLAQAHGTAWGEFLSKVRQRSLSGFFKSPRNLIGMIEDLSYRRFDAMIAIGDVVAQDLRRQPTRTIIGSLPVHLISNGIDPAAFAFSAEDRLRLRAGCGIGPEARVVLSASRLHPQKGVAEGLEGFLHAAEKDEKLHLIIAGDGPDAPRLKRLAAASSKADRIHFVGHIQRESMREWLSAADLFLFTTKRVEGLPLNILEARAAGLPVVASPHVLDPRFGGIAAAPDDPEAIAGAIASGLPTGPIGEMRPSQLAEEFTLNYTADAYLRLFRALMDRRT